MEYRGRITKASFKEVEVKGNPRAILSIVYACDDGKSYTQDLWHPTDSTSEKATEYFWNTLETIGLPKDNFAMVVNGDWELAFLKPDMEFEVETEVDKKGYEKVKYVNDPSSPRRGGSKVTTPHLLSLLGITSDSGSGADEIPFD